MNNRDNSSEQQRPQIKYQGQGRRFSNNQDDGNSKSYSSGQSYTGSAGNDSYDDAGLNDSKEHSNNRTYKSRTNDKEGEVNKIRRGPGRRLVKDKEKDKRKQYMDYAIQNKYFALSEDAKIEVHAVIEMHYQLQMQKQYKGTPEEKKAEETQT